MGKSGFPIACCCVTPQRCKALLLPTPVSPPLPLQILMVSIYRSEHAQCGMYFCFWLCYCGCFHITHAITNQSDFLASIKYCMNELFRHAGGSSWEKFTIRKDLVEPLFCSRRIKPLALHFLGQAQSWRVLVCF